MTYYPRRPRINYAVIDFGANGVANGIPPPRSLLAVLWILLSFTPLAGLAILGMLWIVPLSWFGY